MAYNFLNTTTYSNDPLAQGDFDQFIPNSQTPLGSGFDLNGYDNDLIEIVASSKSEDIPSNTSEDLVESSNSIEDDFSMEPDEKADMDIINSMFQDEQPKPRTKTSYIQPSDNTNTDEEDNKSTYTNGKVNPRIWQYGGQPSKYKFGGDVRKYQLGGKPTRADSLALYNNTQQLLSYYRNKKYYESPETRTPNTDRLTRENEEAYRDYMGSRYVNTPEGIRKPTPEMFHRDYDSNRYFQREKQFNVLDTRAPMALYDKRIKPNTEYLFGNNNPKDPLVSDIVSINGYDPIAVKPVDLLTPEERKIRYVRYKDIPSPTTPIIQKKPALPLPYPNIRLNSSDVKGVNNRQNINVQGNTYHPMVIEQEPTNYSATFRDESKDSKQNTVYFKNRQEWQNFLNSGALGNTDTQEGANSAHATGYRKMQDGGTLYADDHRTQRVGLNNPNYDNAVLNLIGTNTIRGLDNHQPVAVTDGKKYQILYGPKDTAKFDGKVYEKRMQEGGETPQQPTPEEAPNIDKQKLFFERYLQSKKYRERLSNYYPNPDEVIKARLKNVVNAKAIYGDANHYAYSPTTDSGTVILNPNSPEYRLYPEVVKAHEMGHPAGALAGAASPYETLSLVEKADLAAMNQATNEHDKRPTEFKADIDALRYFLRRDKIYDASTQDFTPELLKTVKQKYQYDPLVQRLLKNVTSDEDLIYLMNHIAQNKISNTNTNIYA